MRLPCGTMRALVPPLLCLQVHVPRGAANSKKVEENLRSLEEEVQLLQQFDHPNIVRYLVGDRGGCLNCLTLVQLAGLRRCAGHTSSGQ